MKNTKNKILAWILSGAMVFGVMPTNAFANEIDHINSKEITQITALSEEIATQEFTKGEENAEVNLPETISAQVTETTWAEVEIPPSEEAEPPVETTPPSEEVETVSGNAVEGGEETPQIEGGEKPTPTDTPKTEWQSTTTVETVDLAVTWKEIDSKEFATSEATTFTYTPTPKDHDYALGENIELPTITVNVVDSESSEETKETVSMTELTRADKTELPPIAFMSVGESETGDFVVTGGTYGTDYTYANGVLTFIGGNEWSVSMKESVTSTTDRIVVKGANSEYPKLTLNSVNIQSTETPLSYEVGDMDNATLTLVGTNTLVSDGSNALADTKGWGILIKGDGSLNLTGNLSGFRAVTLDAENIDLDGSLITSGDPTTLTIGVGGATEFPTVNITRNVSTENLTINGGNTTVDGDMNILKGFNLHSKTVLRAKSVTLGSEVTIDRGLVPVYTEEPIVSNGRYTHCLYDFGVQNANKEFAFIDANYNKKTVSTDDNGKFGYLQSTSSIAGGEKDIFTTTIDGGEYTAVKRDNAYYYDMKKTISATVVGKYSMDYEGKKDHLFENITLELNGVANGDDVTGTAKGSVSMIGGVCGDKSFERMVNREVTLTGDDAQKYTLPVENIKDPSPGAFKINTIDVPIEITLTRAAGTNGDVLKILASATESYGVDLGKSSFVFKYKLNDVIKAIHDSGETDSESYYYLWENPIEVDQIICEFYPATNHFYHKTSKEVDVIIAKEEQAPLSVNTPQKTVFFHTLKGNLYLKSLGVTGGSVLDGEFSYKSSDENIVKITADNKSYEPHGIGTVKITATKEGNLLYNPVSTDNINITVIRTPFTVMWEGRDPVKTVSYTGESIAEEKLPNSYIWTYNKGVVGTSEISVLDTQPRIYSYKQEDANTFVEGLPKEVGTYNVRVNIADGDTHYFNGYPTQEFPSTDTDCTVIITKSTPTVVINTISEKSYDGTTITPTEENMTITGASYNDVTFEYYADNSGVKGEKLNIAPTNAGTYWVVAKIAESANSNAVESEAKKFNIIKATYADITTATGSAKYGKTGEVDLSAWSGLEGVGFGEITKSNGETIITGTPTITNGKLSYTLANNTDNVDSTATITILVTSTNYENFSITVTVTVKNKDVPTLSANAISKTYDGLALTNANITGTSTVDGTDITGTWSFKESTEIKNVSDSEVKTVVFTPTNTSEYETAETTVQVTISKVNATVTANNLSANTNDTKPTFTVTQTGFINEEEVTDVTFTENPTVVMNTVGTYTITPSGGSIADGEIGNYNITYTSGTLTVKGNQTLSFTNTEIEKAMGDVSFTNALTGAKTEVTYTSSNEDVAMVNNVGEVTLLSSGTTTITAAAKATNLYHSATKSYDLTVNKGTIDLDKNTVTTFDADFTNLKDVNITVGGNTTTLTRDGKYLTGYTGYTFNQGRIGEVVSGSVEVTLYKEFLAFLPTGSYSLAITETGSTTPVGTVIGTIPAKSSYTLTITGGGTGATSTGTYEMGSIVNINAGTKAGYTFSGWTGATFENGSNAITKVLMPSADTEITANWTKNSTGGSGGSSGGGGGSRPTPKYDVDVVFGSGDGEYKAGQWVTITAEVREGKTFSHWVSDEVTFEDKNASTTRFKMNSKDVKVTAVYVGEHENPQTSVRFEDIKSSDWYYEFVYDTVEKGLFSGTSDTTFSLYNNATRAEMAAILSRFTEEE